MGERQPLSGCGDLQSGRVADLDGEGSPELVAIGSHNNCGDAPILPGSGWNQLSIFTGDANGPGIVPMGAFAAGLAGARLDLGDFDNNGDVDIVVGDDDVNMMVFADGIDEILVEQADESYRVLVGTPSPTAVDVPSVTLVLLTQDLDADGRADIVSAAKSDGKYRLVLTLSAP